MGIRYSNPIKYMVELRKTLAFTKTSEDYTIVPEAKIWLDEREIPYYHELIGNLYFGIFWFKDEQELMLFKLTWG